MSRSYGDAPLEYVVARHRRRTRKHTAEYAVLDRDLKPLGGTGRKHAPPLHRFQVIDADVSLPERFGKPVGGSDRILNGEIDADAADGGHRVSGIADHQQPRGATTD